MNDTGTPVKKVALYDPYLNILGGGERYVLSILKVFESLGYDCSIFWSADLSKDIENKFSLGFKHKLHFIPHILPSTPLRVLQNLRNFDYFIYVTDGSYFFSSAKKNYIYAMVPQKSLYPYSSLNRLKTFNCRFITHSGFTQHHLDTWGIRSQLLYPYIEVPILPANLKKEKIILTVGRFFKHLHSKRQDLAIQMFLRLKKNPEFQEYRLVCAGGLEKEDEKYFRGLQELAGNDPSVIFKPNIPFDELERLYVRSTYYWHFAGIGIDEVLHPELVEHMGIAPLEAMAHRSIPLCYAAGGPKEIIKQGKNGFVFHDENELINRMVNLNQTRILSIRKNGVEYVKKHFGYTVFKEKVQEIFHL